MNAKERRRAAAAVAIAALQDLYPAAFGVYEARRKPLKADIVAAGAVDKRELGRALSVYTCNSGYLRSMTRVGAMRIDLSGAEVAPVTEEEARVAGDQLAWIILKARERGERRRAEEVSSRAPMAPEIPPPPAAPAKRLGLADLRRAAAARKGAAA